MLQGGDDCTGIPVLQELVAGARESGRWIVKQQAASHLGSEPPEPRLSCAGAVLDYT